MEGTELPETFPQHESRGTAAPQPSSENTRTESQPVSPQLITRNRGKQPVSPKSLALQERSDQPDVTVRTEANSVSSPRRLRDKGKEPLVPQNTPKEKTIITERSSHGVRFKEPKVEPGFIRVPKQKVPVTRALIKPKDEPITDEAPIAVIHPGIYNLYYALLGYTYMSTIMFNLKVMLPHYILFTFPKGFLFN